MTIEQLKARAYDILALIQQAQSELTQINQEIAKKNQEDVKDDKKVK